MKVRQRRRAPRARRAFWIVRAFCAFVLAVFMMQTTVAWAFPCDCLHDDCEESSPDPDGKKSCPCPIDCGPCCTGVAMPAMPTVVESLVLPPPLSVETACEAPERAPPQAACSEILRVPKPPRA